MNFLCPFADGICKLNSVLIACLWLLLHHFQTVVGTIGSLSSWWLTSANKNICIPLSERVNSVTDISILRRLHKYWLLIIRGKLDHKYIKYAENKLYTDFDICFSFAMASIFSKSIYDSLGLFHCLLGGGLWVPSGDSTGRGSDVAGVMAAIMTKSKFLNQSISKAGTCHNKMKHVKIEQTLHSLFCTIVLWPFKYV